MPFPPQNPMEFTRVKVEAIRFNQFGVYGLFRQGLAVYVGKGDIRQRLLDHLDGDDSCITSQAPTHYLIEVTSDMDARERQLILEFQPICNMKVG